MDEIVHLNKQNVKKFTFHVCKEHIFMAQVAVFFQKNSYLKDAFDQKIKLLKANGLINYWLSRYIDYNYINVKVPSKGPEKLIINQMLGAFQILFYCLLFSCFMFIFELIIHAAINYRRN